MSLAKLSLGGNNLYVMSLFPPRESLVSDIPAGDGNIEKLFLRCIYSIFKKYFYAVSLICTSEFAFAGHLKECLFGV